MVEPRWLRRQRREAGLAAARRSTLLDRILQQAAATEGRSPSYSHLMTEQGVEPFDLERVQRGSLLTTEDWAELRAALRVVRGG